MELIDTIKNLSVSHRRSLKDDDFFVDRLHHRYTVAVLVLFCAIITTNQYAGEPINCWFVYLHSIDILLLMIQLIELN